MQIRIFTVIAVAEALSWIGLLVGMYYKYLADVGELGVRLFGPIHGVIFIGYVVATLILARALGWSRGTTFVGLVCSVPPFATVLFDLWALRSGRLTARSGVAPAVVGLPNSRNRASVTDPV